MHLHLLLGLGTEPLGFIQGFIIYNFRLLSTFRFQFFWGAGGGSGSGGNGGFPGGLGAGGWSGSGFFVCFRLWSEELQSALNTNIHPHFLRNSNT